MTRPLRVLFIQFSNPAAYPPVAHAATCLVRAGAEVRFLGIDFSETTSLHLPPALQCFVHLRPAGAPGTARRFAWVGLLARAALKALRWRPDWIYASDPAAAPVAIALRGLSQRGVVYHEHDEPARGTLPSIVLRARIQLLREAELVVVPNAARLQRALLAAGASHRPGAFVVWNAARADEWRPSRARAQAPLRLWFHGSINPVSLPPALLVAVAGSRGAVTMDIAGYQTPNDGWIERVAGELNCTAVPAIRLVGPLSRQALLDACAHAHFGVCCYADAGDDPNQRDMAGASNKVFDYLACGLGLLVSDAPQWRGLLGARDDVVFFDPGSDSSCADALRRAMALVPGLATPRRRGPVWEEGFAPVLERMCSSSMGQ